MTNSRAGRCFSQMAAALVWSFSVIRHSMVSLYKYTRLSTSSCLGCPGEGKNQDRKERKLLITEHIENQIGGGGGEGTNKVFHQLRPSNKISHRFFIASFPQSHFPRTEFAAKDKSYFSMASTASTILAFF